ncbi:HAD-IA family hydrolase [Microbacterium sp. YY-01]|uniref:HAD-IA family hydrolase n=1 Tax=Microbacterium sp. YY-01 TaxID=3421634 RepID=UPI003D170D34
MSNTSRPELLSDASGSALEDRHSELAEALRSGAEIELAGMLFDMDGTLVDSIAAVESAWREWSQEIGVPMPDMALHGRTPRAVVEASGVASEHIETAMARLCEIESAPAVPSRVLSGVLDFLAVLPEDSWGVVTSAAGAVFQSRIESAGLPAPTFRITADDVTRGKPHPEPFARGIAELRDRGRSGTIVAFEDSIAGLTSARDAGCLAIGIHGADPSVNLSDYAHAVIPSFTALSVTTQESTLRMRMIVP